MFKKIIVVIAIIFILKYTIDDERKINYVEGFIKDTFLSVNSVLAKSKEIDNVLNKGLTEEIEELKKLLELNQTTSTYKMINATVISRQTSDYYETVIIDKGKKDGIENNMAVINNDGLIGEVIKVTNRTSHVKLITNKNIYSKISVSINLEDETLYGILSSYDVNTNSFLIEGIDDMKKINVGDSITTTGLGNKYPNGIVIGTVSRITKDNYDLTYILKVEPSVNFDNFHYVAVLDRTQE